jgi:hypothetical protein
VAFPVWLPERPHLRFRGSHLAREGRLARASAPLLMHRHWNYVSSVTRREGGTVKIDSDMDAHGWQRRLMRLISDQRMPPCLAPVNMSQLDAFAVFVRVPPERDQTQRCESSLRRCW